jgi:hypothetical protein
MNEEFCDLDKIYWIMNYIEFTYENNLGDMFSSTKVVVPNPKTLSWDVCSTTHLETHYPMHLKF